MNPRIRYNSSLARLIGADAITLYPFVFIAEATASDELMRHELTHIEQVRSVGWLSFYVSYLLFYFAHRLSGLDHYSAYLEIPWEREARDAEGEMHT